MTSDGHTRATGASGTVADIVSVFVAQPVSASAISETLAPNFMLGSPFISASRLKAGAARVKR